MCLVVPLPCEKEGAYYLVPTEQSIYMTTLGRSSTHWTPGLIPYRTYSTFRVNKIINVTIIPVPSVINDTQYTRPYTYTRIFLYLFVTKFINLLFTSPDKYLDSRWAQINNIFLKISATICILYGWKLWHLSPYSQYLCHSILWLKCK